ncbi:hypothetical protein BGZ65_011896 [Modicella reniformis]|uniref:Uncharacterized protein n=1 Tax=Modicella reniformis TaxID=1440133 RepID=A0A9P6ISI2_9FUNG|nr:hypothetical protein BGZ65_011896 [Modicella reniformis]
MERYSLSELTSALRKNCPKLHTIRYFEDYSYDFGFHPEPRLYASLFKDSFSTPGLRCAWMGLPEGLDLHMLDALLFHASTLEILEFKFCLNEHSPSGRPFCTTQDMSHVVELLMGCENLKVLRLSNTNCTIETLDQLLTLPWQCSRLEHLIIEKYKSTAALDPGVQQQKQYEFQHHGYPDVGQGWFLGQRDYDFYEVVSDDDWKHRLFDHMYRISGIKHAKYVKLNKTEFFARDPASTCKY